MNQRAAKWTVQPPLEVMRRRDQLVGDLARSDLAFVRVDLWDRTIELTADDTPTHPERVDTQVETAHEVPASLPSRELAEAIVRILASVEQLSRDDEWALEAPDGEPNPMMLDDIAFELESLWPE